MSTRLARVLLVGEGAKGCSSLRDCLERRGCECHVVTSSSEGILLSADCALDLILWLGQIEGINVWVESLVGSPASLFRCYPVEDSCWWLPIVRRGEECLGAPALRPGEFASALEGILQEIESGKHPRADCELGRQTAPGPHRYGGAEDAARWRR